MLQLFLVCLTAGLAAGIGTGFAGLSAATVMCWHPRWLPGSIKSMETLI